MAMWFQYGYMDSQHIYAVPETLTVAAVNGPDGNPVFLKTSLDIIGRVDSGDADDDLDIMDALIEAIAAEKQPCGLILRVALGMIPTGLWFDGDLEAMTITNAVWPDTGDPPQVLDFSFTIEYLTPYPSSVDYGTAIARTTTWEWFGTSEGDILDHLQDWTKLSFVQTDNLTVIGNALGHLSFPFLAQAAVADTISATGYDSVNQWKYVTGTRTLTLNYLWIEDAPPVTGGISWWIWSDFDPRWLLVQEDCGGGTPIPPPRDGLFPGEYAEGTCGV